LMRQEILAGQHRQDRDQGASERLEESGGPAKDRSDLARRFLMEFGENPQV
jgi:hypothetical protein